MALKRCDLLEQAAEKQAATDYVKTAYSCDQVRGLQMGMQRASFRMSPLYVPAFVISGRQMLGSKLRTFVSGANPQQVTSSQYTSFSRLQQQGAAQTISAYCMAAREMCECSGV